MEGCCWGKLQTDSEHINTRVKLLPVSCVRGLQNLEWNILNLYFYSLSLDNLYKSQKEHKIRILTNHANVFEYVE